MRTAPTDVDRHELSGRDQLVDGRPTNGEHASRLCDRDEERADTVVIGRRGSDAGLGALVAGGVGDLSHPAHDADASSERDSSGGNISGDYPDETKSGAHP